MSGLRVLEHQKQLDQSRYPVYRHRFTVTEHKVSIEVVDPAAPDSYAIPSLLGKVLRHLFLYKPHPKTDLIKTKRFGGNVDQVERLHQTLGADLQASSDFDIVQRVIEAYEAEQENKRRQNEIARQKRIQVAEGL